MKHVLLATTALAMTASFAAAEVSLSGRAAAGSVSSDTAGAAGMAATVKSEVYSGVDINISASVTTDSGVTVTVADDIGGGKLPDYADKELDTQTPDIGTPTVSVAFGGTTVKFDNQAIDDRYDNSQNGDIAIDTTVGGASIGITFDTDAGTHDGNEDGTTTKNATTSYSLGYSMGDITLNVTGTDADDSGNAAMVWSASWAMNSDMTLSIKSDNEGAGDDVTTGTVAYKMGDLALSLSADDNDDWNASATYTAGALSVTYATDEESAWEADVSYAMGSGVALKASSDSTNTSIIGIDFTF